MIRTLLGAVTIVGLVNGCSGSNGAQGAPGPAGANGAAGAQGSQGATGAQGATGSQGPVGSQGDAGPQGATGPQGPAAEAGTTAPPGVYVLSNATGNAIIEYARSATTGELSAFGEFPTGGAGTAMGVGSQGALIFDPAGSHFFAVNPGDDSISELALEPDGTIVLLSNVPSGGTAPISLTLSGATLYVLNAGSATVAANITGFTVDPAGLVPLGSTEPLSAAQPGAEQIAFVQNGAVLVVTEKGTDKIDTFVVTNGVATTGTFTDAGTGNVPYGFGVSGDDLIVVSQATAPTGASSYSISATGVVTTETAFLTDSQTAACWVTVVGTNAYVLNAHNDTVSTYAIAGTGDITLTTAVAATTGSTPTDIAASPDGAFLYTRNGAGQSLTSWAIGAGGALGATTTTFAGIPTASVGLVVR